MVGVSAHSPRSTSTQSSSLVRATWGPGVICVAYYVPTCGAMFWDLPRALELLFSCECAGTRGGQKQKMGDFVTLHSAALRGSLLLNCLCQALSICLPLPSNAGVKSTYGLRSHSSPHACTASTHLTTEPLQPLGSIHVLKENSSAYFCGTWFLLVQKLTKTQHGG